MKKKLLIVFLSLSLCSGCSLPFGIELPFGDIAEKGKNVTENINEKKNDVLNTVVSKKTEIESNIRSKEEEKQSTDEIQNYINSIEEHIINGERTLALTLVQEAVEKYDDETLINIYNVLTDTSMEVFGE